MHLARIDNTTGEDRLESSASIRRMVRRREAMEVFMERQHDVVVPGPRMQTVHPNPLYL